MAFYNINADTKLIVDGSPIGLGAILTQEQDDGTWRPIVYGSHALDPVQQRYGQTERGALAVTFFFQHFHHYLYDQDFTILTDHKPLLHIFASNSDPPPRIQRWMLRLQAYQFNIQHIPGTDMISDYLSRQPLHCLNSDTSAEDFINMIAHNAIPLSCSIGQIARASKADDILQKVVSAIASSQWADKSNLPKTFYQIRHQLSLKEDILLKGNLIVIPTKLQDRILQLAHAQHQGISKTKSLLREKVWWPTINTDVESMIASCHACQVTALSSLNYQPLKMSEIPKSCWHTLAVDMQGPYPTGEHILLLIDYRSRYPVATLLKTITSTTVVSSLHKVFTMFGYPKRICTDNGPQFISRQFTAYLESHAIEHRRVTPHWPSANGDVERMKRTIKHAIQCAHHEGKNWRDELQNFLLVYRTTPHTITGAAPADLMFKYAARNDIPQWHNLIPKTKMDLAVNQSDALRKQKIKSAADSQRKAKANNLVIGDKVLCKNLLKANKLFSEWENSPYTVVAVYPSSAKIQNAEGITYVRHKAHLKPYIDKGKNEYTREAESEHRISEGQLSTREEDSKRPRRTRSRPQRYC